MPASVGRQHATEVIAHHPSLSGLVYAVQTAGSAVIGDVAYIFGDPDLADEIAVPVKDMD